jgi:hypothetical protein
MLLLCMKRYVRFVLLSAFAEMAMSHHIHMYTTNIVVMDSMNDARRSRHSLFSLGKVVIIYVIKVSFSKTGYHTRSDHL